MDDWTEAIDRGDDVDIIYLDFKAAFDKVPHQRLLIKLRGYGIEGEVYNWIKDFLHDRQQQVVVNGKKTALKKCYKWCTTGECSWSHSVSHFHK